MAWIYLVFLGLSLILSSTAVGQTRHTGETGWTGKLLVVPMDGSHWIGLKAVSQELGRRGHTVVVVIPEVSMRLGPGKHYTTRTYPVPYGQDLVDQLMARHVSALESNTSPLVERITTKISDIKTFVHFLTSTGESLLYNQELLGFLREQDFDAVLTDPMVPTGAILAHNLSVPAVFMLRGLPCGLDLVAAACPSPPSYVPRYFTQYTDRMSFGQRVLNMLVSMLEPLMCRIIFWSFDGVASRFLQRDTSVAEILNGAALWLMRFDFSLEYPRPLMPNMVLIGGINCAVRNPLANYPRPLMPNMVLIGGINCAVRNPLANDGKIFKVQRYDIISYESIV